MSSLNDSVNDTGARAAEGGVIYRERLWVPWWYWAMAVPAVVIVSAQIGFNRDPIWLIAASVLTTAIALWVLFALSKTVLEVEVDSSGERWLHAGTAILPASAVAKSLEVPASANRAALGRQLDPSAFLVTHAWVKTMALMVLDDPDDPTPYWLVSSRRPAELLDAFLGADRARA